MQCVGDNGFWHGRACAPLAGPSLIGMLLTNVGLPVAGSCPLGVCVRVAVHGLTVCGVVVNDPPDWS